MRAGRSLTSEESLRAALPADRVDAEVPAGLRSKFTVVERQIAGRLVVTVGPERPTQRQAIYLHGGAYVQAMSAAQWGVVAALAARQEVTVPLFRPAPDHGTIDTELPWLEGILADVADGGPVQLVGDSSGGGLALALAQRARDVGVPIVRTVGFSPWLDAAVANPDALAMESKDVLLASAGLRAAGRWWAGGTPIDSPLVSPVHADLSGVGPVSMVIGDRDMFLPDCETLATQPGVDLHVVKGGFHGSLLARWIPESRRALALANSTWEDRIDSE